MIVIGVAAPGVTRHGRLWALPEGRHGPVAGPVCHYANRFVRSRASEPPLAEGWRVR
jgi:hypothetical protein